MVKIEKTIQPKHKETLSPWLKQYVESAAEAPLPLLPQTLDRFPSRWPFSRGDLYHWIPLLNRFDTILERICKIYGLNEGPQKLSFGCTLLLSQCDLLDKPEEQTAETRLEQLGFQTDGDRHLVESVLTFTRMLLEHCGNRSIYASSSYLNDLLNSTSLTVLIHTLEVGSELAQRYQASVKRIGTASKQISSALLANHYNIDLSRVHQLAQPFVKTPILTLGETTSSATASSAVKGKEKVGVANTGNSKHTATRHASDLVALASDDSQQWETWGDVKVLYYPTEQTSVGNDTHQDVRASQPSTPTPLRRSTTTTGQQNTPRGRHFNAEDSSPLAPKTPSFAEEHNDHGQKSFELPSNVVISGSASELTSRCPSDMPASAKYEVFHRLRVANALKGSQQSRQAILAVRLLAATNLAYIYHESVFIEKVLRQDMDETRQYQLVYQLADLIHPSDGQSDAPLWLQTIALALLEAISGFQNKVHEVLSAVNANVNHGILLYVIRKAVSWMKEDLPEDKSEHITEADEWRNNLFSLTLHLSMSPRVGPEMVSAGLMDVLVDILKIRSKVAQRHHSMVLASLDGLIWTYQNAFTAFFNAEGLDAVAALIVDSVKEAQDLHTRGKGIGNQYRSSSVDYDIPFYQQQTLKWLSKFVHHMMSNSYSYGNNTDRLLRNLAEKSDVLQSLREIIHDKQTFGSVIWTSTVTILADFINNDPTSFAAISESGMIKTYLEAITNRPLPEVEISGAKSRPDGDGDTVGAVSPDSPNSSVNAAFEQDPRPHPPSDEALEQSSREGLAAGILPSSDAIGVVPMVLNSISLNHTGMNMVVTSKAFESFLEIFESEQHVKCMANDRDLASNVGGGFDELARHHPALRTAISNAVIDMVARVRFLGRQKARDAGWGTKLLVTTTEGQVLTVTEEGRLESTTRQGQKHTTNSDSDIDMSDAVPATAVAEDEASKAALESTPGESFTPYAHALANFLHPVISNSILKTNFIDRGGIEVLLDICQSPSLSATFSETYHSRTLNSVVTQLIEHSPVRGLPSLFHRTLRAVETLAPIAEKTDSTPPYFAPFLSEHGVSLTTPADAVLREGTKIAKALLNVQTFIKILADCFTTSRSNTLQFFSVNMYDYYLRLVKSLGPLLRGVLAEEAAEMTMVPESWSVAQLREGGESSSSRANSTPVQPHDALSSDMRPVGSAWSLIGDVGTPLLSSVEGPERSSSRYQNYETLRILLHPLTPTTFPFFQSLGRALLPRRGADLRDPYPRHRQLEIARAVAETVLGHLRPSLDPPDLSSRNFHYWIIMLHTIHEMLIDHPTSRQREQSSVQIIMPVILAFKEENGFELLGKMTEGFLSTVHAQPGQNTDGSPLAKVAAFGLKKMLDLFALLCNGKYITESGAHYSLHKAADPSLPVSNTYQQIVLEIRAAVVPILSRIWGDAALIDKIPDTTIKRIIDVLKLIATAENELQSIVKDKPPFALFKDTKARFNWASVEGLVDELITAGYDTDLANEAAYRANGHAITAKEYCRAYKNNIAGPRNPVPSEDADKSPSESANQSHEQDLPHTYAGQEMDAMSLDAPPEIPEEILRDSADGASILENALAQFGGLERPPSAGPAPANADSATEAADLPETSVIVAAKEKLDQFREDVRQHLLTHVLDIIRRHPGTAIEVCDLITASLLRSGSSQAQEDVPSTLTFALSSLMDEGQRDENAKPIASYAHLLALVLQDEQLFERNLETLRDRAGSYIGLLEMGPNVTSESLPPWLPYVLLLLEMFLCHDERPVAAQWKPPKTLEDEPKHAIVEAPNPIVSVSQRASMLELLTELLAKIGKEEVLATSALRVLVILSRSHELAKNIGSKKNLQRLFLMARQLSGGGSERLKHTKVTTHLTTILRHIIEDDEIVRQVMRAEIKAAFPGLQRSARGGDPDVSAYLRAMAPVTLRSPKLFVEVSNEMVKARRWTDGAKTLPIVLKDQVAVEKTTGTDDDKAIKPTTEPVETGMTDVQKQPVDSKSPAVENSDGIVHYLLSELLNYRDVEDTEAAAQKDPKNERSDDTSSQEGVGKSSNAENKDKDKKSAKPVFKSDDHPIFIYRCLILNILTELLQSYQKAKVEFIHFKRGQPPSLTHAPLKLRQGMMNYMLYDILCQGNLSGSTDTLAAKKKAATASHVQRLFAALVARTSETSVDKTREKYDYDAEPELLFVRKFVLDTILKAYERPGMAPESLEARYSRMQSLAELMIHMAGDRDRDGGSGARNLDVNQARSQAQLRRLMYEQGYLDKLTSSIAEINLNYPNVKRAIKYILRMLRLLTDTAKDLSHSNVLPNPNETFADVLSDSSWGITEDEREETPDLYRNSALGMMEPRGEQDDASDDEDEDDDEDMYGEEYDDDEMDYGDDDLSDRDEVISDDDEEEMSHMGEIEGLHGEPGLVEVIMDEDEDDEDDEDGDSDMDDDDDDDEEEESNSDGLENSEPVAYEDEAGHPMEDDGSPGWESESEDGDEDGDDDEDDADAGGIDYEAEVQELDEGHMHGVGRSLALLDDLHNMARAIRGDRDDGDYDADDLNAFEEHFLEDGVDEDVDDDDDDDDDDMDDEEYIYDDDYPDDEAPPMPALGWDGGDPSEQDRRLFVVDHRHHRRPMLARLERDAFPPRILSAGRDPLDFRSFFSRHSRHAGNRPAAEDGMNPLLRRDNPGQDNHSRAMHGHQMSLRIPDGMFPGGRGGFDGPMNFLGELMEFLPMRANGHGPLHFHITGPGGPRDVREWNNVRGSRHEGRRDGSSQEPGQAVAFSVESTLDRYQEETRMIFGSSNANEAAKLNNMITSLLTPAAMEQEKKIKAEEAEKQRLLQEEIKKREEEQRLAKEAKDAEEAAAKAKQEAEEREAAERAAAERRADQEALAEAAKEAEPVDQGAMEGVESTAAVAAQSVDSAAGSASQPRVMTRIRGEDVDVTELGIDPDYLAALPEEFREEVIAQTVSTRRHQAREDAPTGESTEVFQEFLDALPEELRIEIVQQERQEQRRRNRDENRRQGSQSGGGAEALAPADMDLASILLTFPPELREQILIEQGDDLVDQLPPEMAAQARAFSAQQQAPPPPVVHRAEHAPLPTRDRVEISGQENARSGQQAGDKPQRRAVVQMLDKAGVATLLRLMFITQQGSIRNYLFGVFADVCENRQNRLEVVSSILQILQDGSTDMNAVERSFGQLSLKARKQKDKDSEQKTPQSLKRSATSQLSTGGTVVANSETSPLLIAQQCLDLLNDLCTRNLHVPWLFLTEHEMIASNLRRTLSRKGKSKEKDKDPKTSKYAINSLLTLLDRDPVIESPVIMVHLADVLNRTTLPLQNLERRRREAEKEETTKAEQSAIAKEAEKDNEKQTAAVTDATESQTNETEAGATTSKEVENKADPKRDAAKKLRSLQSPVIPVPNLKSVVRIFVARECSSKTFQNTISTIKNLSCIPGAKETFGQELVIQARQLSENIVKELDALLPYIEKAKSGTEIQGVALAKFSPGASEQNKLLRVLTALDHLFDGKKKPDSSADESSAGDAGEGHDLVNSLYRNSTFSAMWEKLSACLRAIRDRENMLNVATILLPLIESLMVVCKNAASGDTDLTQSQHGKDMVMSSPPPESRTANLFITFTEEHRRILNELVRNNPKLMSGTFALLVKNPKVLEFDNKRNYFNRSVHSRNSNNQSRPSHPALPFAVRREHVFHDSFKHLCFRSGDEMKFGKLNIRFIGEEGVDAGGVTREWFQVLARQMFDANYALFIPVSSDRTTFHPNKLSGINDEHLMFFKFIGRIIGKALYEGRVLDCFFSRAVYKRILGKSVSVKDMESFDPDYYKSLVWMLDNDITDIITETFSVEDDEFGISNIVDLVPGGRDVAVTEDNKAEYVRLVVEHKLLASVKEQMAHFLKGFHDIIPAELISIFNEQELELLISGLPDIDIDDWKANTEYHNYNPSSQQIQWFWRAVRSFDKEERAKLLQFVTGTSKVPLNGFKELEGMNGVSRFNIHRDYGNKDRLPTSHTCFNQLDLPEYENYDQLRSQIFKAITQGSEGFGFA